MFDFMIYLYLRMCRASLNLILSCEFQSYRHLFQRDKLLADLTQTSGTSVGHCIAQPCEHPVMTKGRDPPAFGFHLFWL